MKLVKLVESNELETRAKNHKKKAKGLSPFCSLNPDAGNVEHNVAMFNQANNSLSEPCNNPVSGSFGGNVGCSTAVSESLDSIYELILPYGDGSDADNQWKAARRYNLKYDEVQEHGGYIRLSGSREDLEKYCDAHGQDVSDIQVVKPTKYELQEEKTMDQIDLHYDDLKVTVVTSSQQPSSYHFEYDRDEAQTVEEEIEYEFTVPKSDVVNFIYENMTEDDFGNIDSTPETKVLDFINKNFELLFTKYESMILDNYRAQAREHAEENMNESLTDKQLSEATYAAEKTRSTVNFVDRDKQYLIDLLEDRIDDMMTYKVNKYYQVVPRGHNAYKLNTKRGTFILEVQFDTHDPHAGIVFSIDGKPSRRVRSEDEAARIIIEAARFKYSSSFDVSLESLQEGWQPPEDWVSFKGAWIYPVDGGYEANFRGQHFEGASIDELKIKLTNARFHKQKFSGEFERATKFADNIKKFGRELPEGVLDRHYDESQWEPEDIELHKNTDWKARNYRELPVPEDSFEHEVVAYGLPGGTQRKRVKFIKYIRPNEIFPPYYAPEEDAFEGTVGVMYDDAGKHGKYDIHNRYETQDVYDQLSEAVTGGRQISRELYNVYDTALNILHEGSNADVVNNIKKAFESIGGEGFVRAESSTYIKFTGYIPWEGHEDYMIRGSISMSRLNADFNMLAEDITMAYYRTKLGGKLYSTPELMKLVKAHQDVYDALSESTNDYVAKASALSKDDCIEHLLDLVAEQDFIFNEAEKMIMKYKIEANPDWDLDDILETFSTEQLQELLQKVMDNGKTESWSPDFTDCPACGGNSFDSKRGRCTKCAYRESLDEALEKGEELTLWWRDPSWSKTSPCYASVEYVGRTKDKKYRFRSTTYGWNFILDAKNKTITDHRGRTFDADNSSGWLNRFDEAVNEWYEFSEDDFEDDQMHVNVYGGDSKYCKDCGAVKSYDEDGFAFCPDCNSTSTFEESAEDYVKRFQVEYYLDDDGDKLKKYVYADSAEDARKQVEAAVGDCTILCAIEERVPARYKSWDLNEASYGRYNYPYEVHWISPDGRNCLLGASESIEGAAQIAMNQLDEIMDNPWETPERKSKFVHNLYIVKAGTEQDVTPANVEEYQSKLLRRLGVDTGNLTEASYGGAYDIADDQYFTRDDLNKFADRVVSELNEIFNDTFEIVDVSLDHSELSMEVEGNELGWYMDKVKIDMRRIKLPSDLSRIYAPQMIGKLVSVIKSYNQID